ncbi:PAC2 family protein [Candidatus Poseidoniales archaeon]|nr:PAC2 family protein [Candidatus Poseidoniales archaeon]MDC0045825.1 PAC2 family protein [Candidatus Poseidoniales archaeon]MDC0183682.1 PAC2 family protein [Candidatus Poseidoniales archaeon]
MNRTRVHWIIGDSLPEHVALLEAVPGVGNVGKLVVDALVRKHPSTLVARLIHPDMPPHSTLDGDGLLVPPSMLVHRVMLPDGRNVVTVGGDLQPMTAGGQHEVADAILGLAAAASTPQLLVLAGLAADVEDKAVHVICADAEVRGNLEANDIPVSRDQPEAGMIGVAGLLVALSPIHDVPTVALVAETVGASADVRAADRLAKWMEQALGLPLEIDLDTTEETARKLLASIEVSGSIEEHLGMPGEADDFYV